MKRVRRAPAHGDRGQWLRRGSTWSAVALALALGVAPTAQATDPSDLGDTQLLRPKTVIRAEILDPATEEIFWFGEVDNGVDPVTPIDVEVSDPTNTVIGTFASGSTISVSAGAGAYYLRPVDVDVNGDTDDQNDPMTDWEISVTNVDPLLGRVWSQAWHMDGQDFSNSSDGSFYAVVDGGSIGSEGVVELKAEGLVGFIYFISASTEGIIGGNGRSRDQQEDADGDGNPDWSARAEHPIYLRPPDPAVVGYSTLSPEITNTELTPDGLCDGVAAGVSGATLSFDSNVDGAYHFVCDVNGDGIYDLTGDDDFHLLGEAEIGTNSISWDGLDNFGLPVTPGVYDCIVKLTVGEFHFVASDIESSYLGFRLFQLDVAQDRTGLDMYWNDAEVQSKAIVMLNNEVSLENSGPFGLWSGDYFDTTVPNGNSRAWGEPGVSATKGNFSYLDTYTWLGESDSAPFQVEVFDATLDSDSDGLLDAEEDCVYGTDPDNPDTDGDGAGDYPEAIITQSDPLDPDSDDDGYLDGEELPDPYNPVDTDGDGLEDATDPDDDGDGVLTELEQFGDSDGDGIDDRLDDDDDGDLVPTLFEDENGNGDWLDDDTDGDGIVDYLDPDNDNDGVLQEDPDGDGDATNDDTDGDGIPDYNDPDDDGDLILTEDELDEDGDGVLDDTDGDGIVDYLDPELDHDGDGIPTLEELGDDPDNPLDTDGDGVPDYLDLDSDDDTVPDSIEGTTDTDGDFAPDFQDVDDDGDGIHTIEELQGAAGVPSTDEFADLEAAPDTDGDGAPDYLDPDDDDDGLPTLEEGGFGDDFDGDGLPNHHDPDSDDDGIGDGTEGSDDLDGDGNGNFIDEDADGDTVDDTIEGEVDTDGDGDPDFLDDDDDDDTVPTAEERDDDTDGDGIVDRLDDDDDGDGIPTATEVDDGLIHGEDVDGDGDENWVDTDSDADGLDDEEEGTVDVDGDGVPDYLDPDGGFYDWYRGTGLFGSCAGTGASPVGGLMGLGFALVALVGRRRRS